MELAVVKVRPFNGDKKMHILRFLFPDKSFSVDFIKVQLRNLFPYGFFNPVIERYMIDYAFDDEINGFVSLCNHDYLAQYLTSTIKDE